MMTETGGINTTYTTDTGNQASSNQTGTGNSSGTAASVGNTSVSIVSGAMSLTDDAFDPNPVEVSTGNTVTWTNDDTTPHTVTSGSGGQPDGKFDSSPDLNPLLAPEDIQPHV